MDCELRALSDDWGFGLSDESVRSCRIVSASTFA